MDKWLTGWKEIAHYTGYTERTLRKQIKCGCPITWTGTGKPQMKTDEYDGWRRTRSVTYKKR